MTQMNSSCRETGNHSHERLTSLSRLDNEFLLIDSRDSQEEAGEEVGGR